MELVNVQKKIRKSAAMLGLAPGEEIRGACTTNPTGSVTRMAIGAGVGGAVGAAVATATAADATAAEGMAAGYPRGQMFLAVTSHRVIVCPVAQMSGKPTRIAAEWPIDDVTSISVEKGRLAHPVTIRFRDGSTSVIEAARGSGVETVTSLFA